MCDNEHPLGSRDFSQLWGGGCVVQEYCIEFSLGMENLYLLQLKILPLLFLQDGEGRGEAAALQTPLRGLVSHMYFGFGRVAAAHAQKCVCRGVRMA